MYKASFEIITPAAGKESFVIRKFDRKGFSAPLHYHPEYELTFITHGKGKRFVGNHMAVFESNDLVLAGSNLPHCWKLDNPTDAKAGALVIQFNHDFLGNGFLSVPETGSIARLLKKSGNGMEFKGKVKEQVKEAMVRLLAEKDDFRKLMLFLEVLHTLSLAKDYRVLNKKNDHNEYSHQNRERVHKVFAYIVEHFRGEVSLNTAASIIGMTPNAFCRYFKSLTRKTFIETVTDYRISFATQLLVQTDAPISGICYECGFRDLSHFYKMFASRMKMSPFRYRKQFLHATHS